MPERSRKSTRWCSPGELDLAIAYELTVPPGLDRKRLLDAVPSVVLAGGPPVGGKEHAGACRNGSTSQ